MTWPSGAPSGVAPATQMIHVPVAGFALGRPGTVLTTAGLGSCIAIILHDAVGGIGAMAHVLLPNETLSRDQSRVTKFASGAVPFLLDQLRAEGSQLRPTARLVGGASMFGTLLRSAGINMGERNIDAARAALSAAGIAVVGEDVGGDFGRSLSFDIATGAVRVTSMRRGDCVL